MDKALGKPGSLLAPNFAVTVAKAVLERAPHMPEKDLVDALNKCQSMAAKAQLLTHKGLGKHDNPLDMIRKFVDGTLDDNLEPVADIDDDEIVVKEKTDGQEEQAQPVE